MMGYCCVTQIAQNVARGVTIRATGVREGQTRMDRYPPIADHGLIGDLQTAALVATDGTIDWFCCPRFDSPSVFASLLDRARGGFYRIAPEGHRSITKQLYFPESAVLITRFMAADGVGEVIDFMPIDRPEQATARHELIRMVRVVRGQMQFVLTCAPRFDYGRQSHELRMVDHGALFHTPELTLALHATMELQRRGDDVSARFTLHAGETAGVVLESAPDGPPQPVDPKAIRDLFLRTVEFWRAWHNRSTYHGRWRESVMRSALTLKLMTYAPSGAMVAAVTAGLPEDIGGERNWDYRYTWIRDASFSVYALLGLGYTEEANAFLRWVSDRVDMEAATNGCSGPLKIMYRIDGSTDLHEETLDHFEGYQGSRPVRIGNGAASQLQLDIYGEMMDSLYLADTQGMRLGYEGWRHVQHVLDWLCEHWDQPEEGIWETRGGQKNFTYGRLMSWVALDRAIRIARRHGGPGRPQPLGIRTGSRVPADHGTGLACRARRLRATL